MKYMNKGRPDFMYIYVENFYIMLSVNIVL